VKVERVAKVSRVNRVIRVTRVTKVLTGTKVIWYKGLQGMNGHTSFKENYMYTMTEKLEEVLLNGEKITAKQAINRFGFASPESVRSAVTRLRMIYGIPVKSSAHMDTKGRIKHKYYVDYVPREVVAAGYRALADRKLA
jgi:hypothetical protein